MKSHLLILFFSLSAYFSVHAKDIIVSTSGNDVTGTGSIELPYQTIQKASNIAVSGDVIQVRGGDYREEVNIISNGVTYQTYNNEQVTINGADVLSSWTLTAGSSYQTSMNWDLSSTWGSNQVFCDGEMIELARWPDQTSADIIMPTNALADAASAKGTIVTITDASFNEPDGRWVGAQIWVNLSRNGIDGQGRTFRVTATNAAAHTISFDFESTPVLTNAPWGMGLNTEYFLFNPTSEGVSATGGVDALLSNGEWWKDGNNLYVKTPDGLAPSATGTGTNVIEVKHRFFAFSVATPKSGYTIKGFNLFGCSITTDNDPWTNRSSIVESAHDIVIDGITAKYVSHQTSMTGNYQDEFYYGAGIVLRGRNNTIQNCNIQYAATAALHISGAGNKALNNIIAHTNYMVANSGALVTGFVCKDAEIANNTIYNTTQMAINFKYAQNSNINVPDVFRIHHNTIYNFMRRSGDSGAIDAAGNDAQWCRIDHNIIYNTTVPTGNMTHGVYLDYAGPDNMSRVTIDHNIIYDVPVPILISSTRFVNVFNNVLLSHPSYNAQCVVNWGGSINGIDVKIYNNIMSGGPNVIGSSPNLRFASISNNITNATGSVLTDLFVNAPNHDYRLKPTAFAAIDKGLSVGIYDENIIALVDLGAFEQGTQADDVAPSSPTGIFANTISNNSFTLNWTAASDNVQVTGYNVYLNGNFYGSTASTKLEVTGLLPSTIYSVTIKALDYYNNISDASSPLSVSTVDYPGRTLHFEAENNNSRFGGLISNGNWNSYKTGGYIQFTNVSLSNQNFFHGYIACTSAGAQLEIRLNSVTGTLLGTLTTVSTGSISTFQIQSANLVSTPTGVYDIYIVAANTTINSCKLDWLELSGGNAVGQIPTAPQNLTTTFVGATRLNLNWIGSIDDVAVTGYEVFKNGVSAGVTTTNSMLFEGLTPSTNYEFSVRSTDASNNWSEQSDLLGVTTYDSKLTGIIIGTDGTWSESSIDDKTTVFDGNVNTFFDSSTENYAWVGIELSKPHKLTNVLFYPRNNNVNRMINGVFQGSNSADFSTGVIDLFAIRTIPTGQWEGAHLTSNTPFKYIRYKSPVGGYGNVAEIEFYGSELTSISNVDSQNSFVIFPNPASDYILLKNLDKGSKIIINSIDGKTIYQNSAGSLDGDLKLTVSNWDKGMYIINVYTKSGCNTQKLIVK